MKMKVLLSVIVFTLYTVSYAQNMKMIDTSMPKKDKKDAVVIEYDSLTIYALIKMLHIINNLLGKVFCSIPGIQILRNHYLSIMLIF